MSKKLICYSWWGKTKKSEFYSYGVLENTVLAKELYPDWTVRVYYEDGNVDEKILKKAEELALELNNLELVKMPNTATDDLNTQKTMWRFAPMFTEDDIIYICRDLDSRLSVKEVAAVNEWLDSDKDFHIMRDHREHMVPIIAGIFGCRNNICKPLADKFFSYKKDGYRGVDQDFLAEVVYPYVVGRSMIHASHCKFEGSMCRDFPPYDTSKYDSFCCAYVRTAPIAFKLLNEEERLLDTLHEYQKM